MMYSLIAVLQRSSDPSEHKKVYVGVPIDKNVNFVLPSPSTVSSRENRCSEREIETATSKPILAKIASRIAGS